MSWPHRRRAAWPRFSWRPVRRWPVAPCWRSSNHEGLKRYPSSPGGPMAKDKKRRDKASAPSAPDAAASPNPIESVVGVVGDAVGAVAGAVAGAVERAAETVAHAADSAT